MKSKVNYNKINKNNDYPYLGVFDDGAIVMFIAEGEGVCVHAGEGNNYLGEYSDFWAENNCEYYDGEVNISND